MKSDFYEPGIANVQSDDIISLQQYLDDENFAYLDVAAAQAHGQVLQRWLLLSELHGYLDDAAQSRPASLSPIGQLGSAGEA